MIVRKWQRRRKRRRRRRSTDRWRRMETALVGDRRRVTINCTWREVTRLFDTTVSWAAFVICVGFILLVLVDAHVSRRGVGGVEGGDNWQTSFGERRQRWHSVFRNSSIVETTTRSGVSCRNDRNRIVFIVQSNSWVPVCVCCVLTEATESYGKQQYTRYCNRA